MSRDKTARLRMDYTGEPYSAALRWYRSRGLFNGLVPEAASPQQRSLEAAVITALARSAAGGLPLLSSPGTVFGLEGVSPDVDTLLLRPAGDLVAQVLARVLPSIGAAGITGVPGLRAQVSRRTGLSLGRADGLASIEVQPSTVASVSAAQEDLREAAAIVAAAGMTPLWSDKDATEGEGEAWNRLQEGIVDGPTWSIALRRIGLFIDKNPDWTRRVPTPEEVVGPKPERIRPRPVGPGSQVRGVVAITSGTGRGGVGCTTAAVALAGALARGGASVGMLAAQDDPSGLAARHPDFRSTEGGRWSDLVAIEGAGRICLATAPRDAVQETVSQARSTFDIVVMDAGDSLAPLHSWADIADVVVAIMPHERDMWAERRVVDCRPRHIRFFAWLDAATSTRDGRQQDVLERLLTFLDEEFLFYVTDREEDGVLTIYDSGNPSTVEQWWSGYNFADQIGPDEDVEEDDEDDALRLPAENDAPFLDQWRTDFLSLLVKEGSHRHSDVWAQVTAQWAGRNKQRNLNGLAPGENEHPGATNLASDLEEAAIAEWGLEMWQAYFPVWEAARKAGDNLLQPWGQQLEAVTLPREVDEVATHLHVQLNRIAASVPTIVALARAESGLGADRVTELRDTLMDEGFAGLVVLPELRQFAGLLRDVSRVTERSGEAAGAANRLAHVVSNTLQEASEKPQPHS